MTTGEPSPGRDGLNGARKPTNVLVPTCLALLMGFVRCANAAGPQERNVNGAFPIKMDAKRMARMKEDVAYMMSISEEQLRAMVPRQSGIYFTDCPNCSGGTQDRANWKWLPQSPRQLTCRDCGEVYPDNPKYPDNEFIEIAAPAGTHQYHYYEREDGYRIFFRAAADYLAKEYLAARCRDLAQLYAVTGDEGYARRASAILVRFAEVYPAWAYKFDYPFREKKFSPYTQNRVPGVTTPYRASRWSWWAHMGISTPLLAAYESLKAWPELAAMADGKAQSKIEQDLFGAMVEFVMGFHETYDNMSPGTWCSYIRAGHVLDRSDWVLEAARRTATFMGQAFLYDGFWCESTPAYCSQVLGNMRGVVAALQGYTPPGDTPPAVTTQLGASLNKARSGIRALEAALAGTHMPHGGFVTINDTWAKHKQRCRPCTATEPHLLPGLGLAVLGGGTGKQQLYTWLDYTAGGGHQHHSALNMSLFAHGNELFRDIGYTHTAWRSWVDCTASHNTVVVNGLDSGFDHDRSKHRLRAFAADGKGFHLTEAESDAAYPGNVTRYRRTLACAGENSVDAYLIDVFQVRGGTQHDYLLHGSATEDSTATVNNVRLQPYDGTLMNPGLTFQLPTGESSVPKAGAQYGFVRNLQSGSASGSICLDMRLSSVPAIGTRTHLAAHDGDVVYLGEAPRIRQAERADVLLKDYYAPFFCLRRQGKNLTSTFVAVHEPVNGRARIRGMTTTEVDGVLLVAIDRGEAGTDHFVMALGDKPAAVATHAGKVKLHFAGRWGFARTRNGKATALHSVDASVLALGDTRLEGIPAYEGIVRDMRRGATAEGGSRGSFDIAATIASDAKVGALLIEFADRTVRGYNVRRVEPLADGTRLHVAEDPAWLVRDGAVHLTSYPQRSIQGDVVRYRLPVVGRLLRPATPPGDPTNK